MGSRPDFVGRSADLFIVDDDRVLRRYRDPAMDCDYEARVMEHVRDHGFPVPAVHDAAGPDLVLDRIEGITMLEAMRGAPWTITRHAALLARLHQQLHQIAAPPWMQMSAVPGDAILHMDLHPLNVMITADGPVVIDWPNARRGGAMADVAHTWLVVGTARPESRLDRAIAAVARAAFLRRFLAEFPRQSVVDILPAVAEHWVADRNITDREREATRRLLAKVTAS